MLLAMLFSALLEIPDPNAGPYMTVLPENLSGTYHVCARWPLGGVRGETQFTLEVNGEVVSQRIVDQQHITERWVKVLPDLELDGTQEIIDVVLRMEALTGDRWIHAAVFTNEDFCDDVALTLPGGLQRYEKDDSEGVEHASWWDSGGLDPYGTVSRYSGRIGARHETSFGGVFGDFSLCLEYTHHDNRKAPRVEVAGQRWHIDQSVGGNDGWVYVGDFTADGDVVVTVSTFDIRNNVVQANVDGTLLTQDASECVDMGNVQ